MSAKIDLTSQKYGYLTVIEPADNIKNRSAWRCRCECGREVITTTKYLRSGKRTSCGCKSGLDTLHYVDGTCIEMIRNNTVRSNNQSGVSGVFFDKRSGKWRAEIMFQGKRRYLGRFLNFSDAVKARSAAKEKLHGEFVSAYLESRQAL